MAGRTPRSPGGSTWRCSWSQSGANGSPRRAYPAWKIVHGLVGRGLSPLWRWWESRRWPVSCRPSPGCRCRGGAPRSWPWRRSPVESWRRSRRPRCGVGWPRTSSSPGSTGRGSSRGIRTSRSRRPGCWICTPGRGRASCWARASSWCARTRRPRSRPGVAATPRSRRARLG
jgi:hypothetical protein